MSAIQLNGRPAFVLNGGPMHRISVNGKIIEFEMHPWCGPNILNQHGEPLRHQPRDFLHAASLWAQQGKRFDDDGLCLWYHEPKDIVEHLGGRHWKIVGQKPGEKGF